MAEHSRRDTMRSLKPFFYPRTIAIVGASREETSIGYALK